MSTHGPTALVAIVLAVGASAIIAALKRDDTAPPPAPITAAQQVLPLPGSTATTSTAPAAQTPPMKSTAPPGPAPAGKVWSTEHGHWHDAPTSSPIRVDMGAGPVPVNSAAPPMVSPTGELPPQPGMIWSAEHKHWHFPDTGSTVSSLRVFPQGPPPERPPQTGSRPQPPGPAPAGLEWSAEHGHWHKKDAKADSATKSPQR